VLSRRELLAGGALTCTSALHAAEHFAGPLGLEIYSLRREATADLPGTLRRIRRFGLNEVEVPGLYGRTANAFRKELDSAGLRATAYVAQDAALREDLAAVAAQAHALGVSYVLFPWIPHSGAFTRDDAVRAADRLNAWGATLRRDGLDLCYHPHGYEFRPAPEGTLFDLLAARTDPEAVNFQFDVFWLAWPGQDPARLIRRYAARARLIHLKDLRKGVRGNLEGQAPEDTSVALGTGAIDFPAVLHAAKRAGVRRYYVEDEALDAAEQIPRSLAYLKSVTF